MLSSSEHQSLPLEALAPGPCDVAANRHLASLAQMLERELQHCQQQMHLACAISGRLASLRDPDDIQRMLVSDFAAMLGADAAFLDQAGCCARVHVGDESEARGLVPQRVRAALADYIESVRIGRRVIVVQSSPMLGDARALVGSLTRADREPGVVIAVRAGKRPMFSESDVRAAEMVLNYGAETLANVVMVRHIQRTTLETVYVLVNAIDAKDNYTSAHSERVGAMARLTGRKLGLSEEQLQTLEWAGLLHDVGKIGVPEYVLNKPGPLTTSEMDLMRAHCRIGYEILNPVSCFEPFLKAVLYHHENHDGSGYPEGLSGDAISLEARVVHVVDIYDALTTRRPYREAFSPEAAIATLKRDAGRVTDPEITSAFLAARSDAPDFASAGALTLGRLRTLPAAPVVAAQAGARC